VKVDDRCVTAPDDLLTISVYAQRVGLTPSALRFYDDCGLLKPAHVDAGSGYRFYAVDQESRGVLLRSLRDVDLPLADVRAVLDGAPEDAARVLLAHVRALEAKVEPARRVAAGILGSLPGADRACWVTLSGAEFASAARQVIPAVAQADDDPALTCVLLDLGADEASFVATDRYRLAVRVLKPRRFDGIPRQILIPATVLADVARWAARGEEVRIEAGGDVTTLVSGDDRRVVTALPGEFPDYRTILVNIGAPATRVIVDRMALLNRLVDGGPAPVIRCTTGDDRLIVSTADGDGSTFDAICSGPAMTVAFGTGVLGAALSTSVGPDVLLELVAPNRPVVVRSADQGTFTTLVMPVRLDPEHR
jgi:DNA-binding transcriptional MerR regulator